MRFFLTIMMTTMMMVTGGFGAFPENPITTLFQQQIGKNFPASFLNPINSYLNNLSAPTIQPQPASTSEPSFDLIASLVQAGNQPVASVSTISLDEIKTSIARVSTSMTAIAATTATAMATLNTATSLPTSTFIPSSTPLPSVTVSPTLMPTATFVWVYVPPTKTPEPVQDIPTDTPTFTFTPSFTPTVVPAGFTLSNISLNTLTNGGAVFAWTNSTFTVNYNYTVWAQGDCPGCVIQLVSGMGSNGMVGTTNCAYSGQPGVSPGVSGTSALTLTAPATPGTYDIVVQLLAQTSCANAISAYSGASGIYKKIGQVVVNSAIVAMYSAGTSAGNLGGRSGADAACVTAKPVAIGNTKIHAFISVGPGDAISDLPANYGVANNVPIVFNSGQLIAKDWTDLLDGSINAALTLSGVPSGSWWSGSESDSGNAIAATANCTGFTDGSSTAWGNFGKTNTAGSGWISSATPQACSNSYTLLCVAGP